MGGSGAHVLDDLTDPRYRDQLVVENPATFYPGLAFLLATVAAHDGGFSGASGGDGTNPLVVSYATDPAAEVYFSNTPMTAAPVGVLTRTCWRQVEFASVLTGTDHPTEAQQVIEWMLSPASRP